MRETFDPFSLLPGLREAAEENNRDRDDVMQWLFAPTTYFNRSRPIDHLNDPDEVVRVAKNAWGIVW